MRYLKQVLRDNETLLLACRLHWIVFFRAAALAVLALVLLIAAGFWPSYGIVHQVLLYAGLLCLILCPFYALAAFIAWYSTEIAVTDRRVLYKRGIISRRSVEMNITKVETVDVDQGLLGRMLNFGDVVVRGTGGTFEPLRRVATPIALRNAILVG